VNNTVAGEAAYNLADAYAKNIARVLGQSGGGLSGGGAPGVAAPPVFGTQVINLLKVRDAQQVMLEVRVAEVSKDLLEQIGVSFIGGTSFINPEYAGDGFRWAVPPATANGNLIGWLLANTAGAKVDLQQTDSLVKILAAPTIVAVSGQEGRFLVGGKAFLPVAQSGGNLGAITLQEQDYGVGLKFIPTVLENGRISLKVSPEVSEITNQTITSSTGGANNAATFPVFVTRQASTTVQLQNGQSLVIGGLLRNNVSEVVNSVPLLGQLPIIGALFRSSKFVENKTELIILVRPVLVEATAKTPELPTDNFIKPSKTEFFLEGKLEGAPKNVLPVQKAGEGADTATTPNTQGIGQ
jgi:pilus assembly protein CpaC